MIVVRVFVLAILVLGSWTLVTAAPDLCDVLSLDICDNSFNLPTGFAVKKCGKPALPCGIKVTSKKVSACTQAMQSIQDRAESVCHCVPELMDWLKKCPALIQAGVREAADPITGITSPLLSGVATTTACLINAGLQAKNVNKDQLMDQLVSSRPATPLAGIQAYDFTYLPTITLASYLDVSVRAVECVGGLVATLTNPAAIATVPLACQSLVDWIAIYADTSLQTLVALVQQQLQPLMDYLEELLNVTAQLFVALDLIVSPVTWNGFIGTARQAAAAKGCADPATCYGGLLADAWRELNKLPVALNGTHQVFITLQTASNTASDYLQQTRRIFCYGVRQLDDASFRKLSLYKALALAIKGEKITPDNMLEHPRILAGMAAQFSGLPHLDMLTQQSKILKNQTAAVQAQFDDAIAQFPGKANDELNNLYYKVNAALNPSAKCPDGSQPASCFVDQCYPPFTPPTCAPGSQCVTNSCNGCSPKCTPIPPTAADATAAYAVFLAWFDALQALPEAKEGIAGVKQYVPRLYASLDYLQRVADVGLDVALADAVRYGILTYNRRASASFNVPCYQGNAEKCFKYQKWKACMNYPKFSSCLAATDIPMPNEHIPWIAVHAGIDDVLLTALSRLNPDLARRPPQYSMCR